MLSAKPLFSAYGFKGIDRRVFDLPVEDFPGLFHMRRQRRGQVQPRARYRMIKRDRPRVQMQFTADVSAQLRAPAVTFVELAVGAVFSVPDDRMTQLGHMRPQLVGPACN